MPVVDLGGPVRTNPSCLVEPNAVEAWSSASPAVAWVRGAGPRRADAFGEARSLRVPVAHLTVRARIQPALGSAISCFGKTALLKGGRHFRVTGSSWARARECRERDTRAQVSSGFHGGICGFGIRRGTDRAPREEPAVERGMGERGRVPAVPRGERRRPPGAPRPGPRARRRGCRSCPRRRAWRARRRRRPPRAGRARPGGRPRARRWRTAAGRGRGRAARSRLQPAGREADGPAGVGVDPLARGDPVEEPAADQLDVPADPAAQVDQVDADVVGVTVDEEPDEVDAEAPSGEVCTWTTRSCVAAAAKISSSSGAHLGGVGAPAKQARPAPLAAAPPTMKQEVVSVRCWTSIVTEWMH